ncbi:MAG: uroporphyrinogen-III synthase [Halapricum sp.]
MTETDVPRVAVFRPDDERLAEAAELLEGLGASPVVDSMLEIRPSGTTPRTDATFVVFTSKTGVELVDEAGWTAGGATLCAIGPATADALREAGYAVDIIPETYTSAGLVDALEGCVDGDRVEVARSDHGSSVLIEGLFEAGAYVHETVLYRLVRPNGSGESARIAADGDLDGAVFTSSLTVENFLEAAEERGIEDEVVVGLNDAVVGTIGPPTRETAVARGIEVDVVPESADFEALARAVVERVTPADRN